MKLIVLLIGFLLTFNVFSQEALRTSLTNNPLVSSFTISTEGSPTCHIRLTNSSHLSDPLETIHSILRINNNDLALAKSQQINDSITIYKVSQFINGVKIEHGIYSLISIRGKIKSIHSESYVSDGKSVKPMYTEDQALTAAISQLGSEMYSWESTRMLIDAYRVKDPSRIKALEKALEEDIPNAKLVFVKDYYSNNNELELAYCFIIESLIPEFRDKVYVSAIDGRILLRDPQIKHGVGDTRYSGRRTFPTTQIAVDTSELKGIESVSGIYCETRSLQGLGGIPVSSPAIFALSEPIQDGDETTDPCLLDDPSMTTGEYGFQSLVDGVFTDVWNRNEHKKARFTLQSCCGTYTPNPGTCNEIRNDDLALDAQWGAAMVARYWKQIHNRNGYDDQGADILSYVHHGDGYENASWNGLFMKYGDGGYQGGLNPAGMFGPLTSLDVCAHEIGHAICTSTSDLVYVGESGAMNEGFSDIWSAAIEQFVLDSIDGSLAYLRWGIGEQADERDMGEFNSPNARALRWMDHPPAENNPDTYGAGTWWQNPDCEAPSIANDFCGVHFNSGVLNKWFYLLTEGSHQPYTPGLNKPASDDGKNDKMQNYTVTGIGLNKAEQITYGAEVLLSPNSRFADMRAASIDVARSLYGPCSNEMEQTIRAWYAVGVGPDFMGCAPTIEFDQFNLAGISERSPQNGCSADTVIHLGMWSYMTTATINFTLSGSAIQGEDYDLVNTSLSFNGDEMKLLGIRIYDDKVEEENDTIIVSFTSGGISDSDTLVIVDDDGIPAVGPAAFILSETFDINDNSWQQELVNPTSMFNQWYIDSGNSNQAHVAFDGTPVTPSYYQLFDAHVRLKSPLINGIGRQNIHISFDFEAGGEKDLVDTTALFDYGTFQISEDGFKWTDIKNYVGTNGGATSYSGTYNASHTELNNKTFYLGYVWQNDALNGGAYSFSIDNVQVSGEGLEIESEVNDHMEADVPKSKAVAFISVEDTEVIAIIEDSKQALGCTDLSIIDNSITKDTTASICKNRSTKVVKVMTTLPSDSLKLTLYFKENETNDWADPLALNILAVHDSDIDNFNAFSEIIDNQDIVINDQRNAGNGYLTYTFWTSTSAKTFALTDRPGTPTNYTVTTLTDHITNSLRQLIDESCPEDTIRFDLSLSQDTIKINSSTITIKRNLAIIGNGIQNTIISGNDSHNIFHITQNAEVYLDALQLTKGESVINGGAFNNEGMLKLGDLILSKNKENGAPKAFTNNGSISILNHVKIEE